MSRNKPGSWKKFRRRYIENSRPPSGVFTCEYCNCELTEGEHPPIDTTLTIDHVLPLSKGGNLRDLNNLVISCWKCNNIKADEVI